MQQRMINHQMGSDGVSRLLERAKVAAIATVNEDGTPYVTPIHYVCLDGRIYFHGLGKGQKVGNIAARPSVSMTVWEMDSLIIEGETPCNVNTGYESVVNDRRMPDASVRNTAVVRVEPESVTGKTYP